VLRAACDAPQTTTPRCYVDVNKSNIEMNMTFFEKQTLSFATKAVFNYNIIFDIVKYLVKALLFTVP
jgi:hypothetical protein